MEPTQTPEATPEKKGLWSRLTPKQKEFLRGKYAVSNAATVLVLVIYALLLLSRLIDAAFLSRESQYNQTFLS